ncbi:hypothetical protein POKO110462_17100 [Pontibacter korlensis]
MLELLPRQRPKQVQRGSCAAHLVPAGSGSRVRFACSCLAALAPPQPFHRFLRQPWLVCSAYFHTLCCSSRLLSLCCPPLHYRSATASPAASHVMLACGSAAAQPAAHSHGCSSPGWLWLPLAAASRLKSYPQPPGINRGLFVYC